MNDTPRTDAMFIRTMKFAGKVDACETFAEFSRQLERELNALRAAGDALLKCCEHIPTYYEAEEAILQWKKLTK
jgi:hypothetical protein